MDVLARLQEIELQLHQLSQLAEEQCLEKMLQIEAALSAAHTHLKMFSPDRRDEVVAQLNKMLKALALRQEQTKQARAALVAEKQKTTEQSRGGMVYAQRRMKRG